MKKFQTNFSKKYKNWCIEGRDISTKILPNSDLKFYFICSLSIAAKRRYLDLKKKDRKIKLKNVKKALSIRNQLDINRKYSPLKKTKDSILISTSKLSRRSCFLKIKQIMDKKLKA